MWKYIGCHEFGHTGGLGHRMDGGTWSDADRNSCMNQETIPITNFDSHDLAEINEDV